MLSPELIQTILSLTTLQKIKVIQLLANELEAEELKRQRKKRVSEITRQIFKDYHDAFERLAQSEREDALPNKLQ